MSDENYKSSRGRCKQFLVDRDVFGQPFSFLMPDGEDSFKTMPGAIISLFVTFFALVYGGFKLSEVINRTDYTIQ